MTPSGALFLCEVDYTGTGNFYDFSIANDVTLKDIGKTATKLNKSWIV